MGNKTEAHPDRVDPHEDLGYSVPVNPFYKRPGYREAIRHMVAQGVIAPETGQLRLDEDRTEPRPFPYDLRVTTAAVLADRERAAQEWHRTFTESLDPVKTPAQPQQTELFDAESVSSGVPTDPREFTRY